MSTALVPATLPAVRQPQPADGDEWDRYVPMWLHGRPESTVEVYQPVIDDFRDWINRLPIRQITLKLLQDYADRFQGQKPRTVERKLATVKSLLSFCHKTGLIPFDVGKALRLPRIPDDLAGKILTVEDVQRVIRMEPTPRNQVLIRVLYISGIRASEAAGLRWMDVQPRDEGGQISVLGKGRKTRTIRLPPPVWRALQSIRPQKAGPDTPVFVTEQGKRMNRTFVTTVVARAAKRAGLPQNVSAHWLRHCHGTHALDRGAPLPLIQQTLGHADLSTTSRYLHVRPEQSSATWLKA